VKNYQKQEKEKTKRINLYKFQFWGKLHEFKDILNGEVTYKRLQLDFVRRKPLLAATADKLYSGLSAGKMQISGSHCKYCFIKPYFLWSALCN